MSNPLLRPNDPRFQRPPLHDGQGNNVFADPEAPVTAEPADGQPLAARPVPVETANVFAAPAADGGPGPTYQPQFETTHQHRGILLLVLAVIGLAGSGSLALAVTGFAWGLVGLLGIVPAATAGLLAMADVKAMHRGAIDSSGLVQTRLAMWLAAAAVAVYAAVGLGLIIVLVIASLS